MAKPSDGRDVEVNSIMLLAAVQLTAMVGDIIRDTGADGIPSGVLYGAVMSHMQMHTYDAIVEALKLSRLVEERHRVLKWIGPAPHEFKPSSRDRLQCVACGWSHGSIVHGVR